MEPAGNPWMIRLMALFDTARLCINGSPRLEAY